MNYSMGNQGMLNEGNVKRVAAFYQFLCRTEEEKTIINLELIVNKLKTTHIGWINEFNKTVPSVFKHDRSRTVNKSM